MSLIRKVKVDFTSESLEKFLVDLNEIKISMDQLAERLEAATKKGAEVASRIDKSVEKAKAENRRSTIKNY